jgi:hypothetical protein
MMMIVASCVKGRMSWLLVQQGKEGRKGRKGREGRAAGAACYGSWFSGKVSRKNTRMSFYEHRNGGNEEEALFHVSRVVSGSTPPSLGLQDAVSDVVRASFHFAPPA